MPIYEYACSDCGYQMEARQRLTDPPLRQCPNCERETLDRLISESSFALRGGGWYSDGYGPKKDGDKKDGDKKDGDKKDAPAAASGAKADAPKADAPAKADKPAAASPKPSAD